MSGKHVRCLNEDIRQGTCTSLRYMGNLVNRYLCNECRIKIGHHQAVLPVIVLAIEAETVGNITILEAQIVATLCCMCKVVVVSEAIKTTPCNRGIATPVICFGISMNNTMVRRV